MAVMEIAFIMTLKNYELRFKYGLFPNFIGGLELERYVQFWDLGVPISRTAEYFLEIHGTAF